MRAREQKVDLRQEHRDRSHSDHDSRGTDWKPPGLWKLPRLPVPVEELTAALGKPASKRGRLPTALPPPPWKTRTLPPPARLPQPLGKRCAFPTTFHRPSSFGFSGSVFRSPARGILASRRRLACRAALLCHSRPAGQAIACSRISSSLEWIIPLGSRPLARSSAWTAPSVIGPNLVALLRILSPPASRDRREADGSRTSTGSVVPRRGTDPAGGHRW